MGFPCSLFRPELYWWRLVLTLRKFCIVGVALMFSSTPLFQAWYVLHCQARHRVQGGSIAQLRAPLGPLSHAGSAVVPVCARLCVCFDLTLCSLSVGIIFVSYALHMRYLPFLDPNESKLVVAADTRNALASGVRLLYVREQRAVHCTDHVKR